jgi:hypothetical protein
MAHIFSSDTGREDFETVVSAYQYFTFFKLLKRMHNEGGHGLSFSQALSLNEQKWLKSREY